MPVQIWPDSFKGKVAIGKARYLLNIMLTHLDVQVVSFPYVNRNKCKQTQNQPQQTQIVLLNPGSIRKTQNHEFIWPFSFIFHNVIKFLIVLLMCHPSILRMEGKTFIVQKAFDVNKRYNCILPINSEYYKKIKSRLPNCTA